MDKTIIIANSNAIFTRLFSYLSLNMIYKLILLENDWKKVKEVIYKCIPPKNQEIICQGQNPPLNYRKQSKLK